MKRILAVFLAFIMVFSLCACKKSQNNSENNSVSGSENNSVTGSQNNSVTGSENNSEHYSQNTNKEQSQSNVSNGVVTENVKIDTLDKLNFYAVKNAIAQNETVLLTGLNDRPTVQTLESKVDYNILNLTGSTSANIDANSTFTITMYSYFTITLNDPKGFLAQKLGGTGNVEVVITTNNFNNMITFKKGERYYSCLQTSSTKKAMSFSTYKYVNGFKLVENYAGENYQFTVYFEGDKVIGMNSGRFNSDSNNFNYSPDDITLSNTFSFVVYKIQSFTAKQLEGLFTYNNSIISDGIGLNDGTVLYGQASLTDNAVAFKDSKGKTVLRTPPVRPSASSR